MEKVSELNMIDPGTLLLKQKAARTGEGNRASQDYGRAIREKSGS